MKMADVLLGVNIDHIATLRNARGTNYPDPFDALDILQKAGSDSVTIHLREDRRHIMDHDVERICEAKILPVNLEMAATEEMLSIAIKNKPHEVCLVPEKREELTTEGGLDVISQQAHLTDYVKQLQAAGIKVSLFVDPDEQQIIVSKAVGADIVELHTGKYAELSSQEQNIELERLHQAAELAHRLGLVVNAGHGLTVANVNPVAKLPHIYCLNIGHSIIADSVFIGLEKAIAKMSKAIRR